MPRCACAIATKWWKPASNPLHGDYCSQIGRTGPWAGDRPAIHVLGDQPADDAHPIDSPIARVFYDDGVRYGRGWPTMDVSAYVLESSFDLNRDPV